ncbi:MAG TPA: nickel pincer cofactor biosynthesis protein LarC [Terriglobales bacterium]|nr:nickel pincer cofactor biosynthesis protein LarC [Terriglobales bacterium]
MRIAYLDCFSGVSGDMFLGALVDAGVSTELLEKTVAALNVGARLEISRVVRGGVSATKVDVIVGGEKDVPREVFQEQKSVAGKHEHRHDHGHTHDHHHAEHSHSHAHEHGHEHANDSGHTHGSEHTHSHGGSLREIRNIISHASISESAKGRATAIFEALGRAESKIHNADLESIHFHEVGSADAIVDIVCAAVGSEALGVDQWMCSPLNVGGGTVVCAHGTFPVPAPATVELLKSRNAPVFSTGVQKELVTPTGAAIVSVLADHFGSFPTMSVGRTGYGAGYRDLPGQANVLRLTIGESVGREVSEVSGSRNAGRGRLPIETVTVLETTIDDMTPQMFGHFLDKALEAGALDAFVSLVQMKKNRPGMLLTVLTRPEDRERIARLVFAETTTIGLRTRDEQRYALPRKQVAVQTRWGEVRVKVADLDGIDANCTPEYEDCRRIAAEHGIPLKSVMQEAMRMFLQESDKKNNG